MGHARRRSVTVSRACGLLNQVLRYDHYIFRFFLCIQHKISHTHVTRNQLLLLTRLFLKLVSQDVYSLVRNLNQPHLT